MVATVNQITNYTKEVGSLFRFSSLRPSELAPYRELVTILVYIFPLGYLHIKLD